MTESNGGSGISKAIFSIRDMIVIGGVLLALGGVFIEVRSNSTRLGKIEEKFVTGDSIRSDLAAIRQELNELQRLEREDASAISALKAKDQK